MYLNNVKVHTYTIEFCVITTDAIIIFFFTIVNLVLTAILLEGDIEKVLQPVLFNVSNLQQ